MTKTQILGQFREWAKKLGGEFIVVESRNYFRTTDWTECPFNINLGINYKDKIVAYFDDKDRPFSPGHICHEMGHVFASKIEPRLAQEGEFLAWEMLLAKKIGIFEQWAIDSKEYELHEDYGSDHINDIDHASRMGLLPQVFNRAKKGVDNIKRNTPISVR